MNENYDKLQGQLGTDVNNTAQKISKVLNLGSVKLVNCGSFGCAYRTEGGKILKLTTESGEAANAKKLLGVNSKHLANYELVKSIRDKDVWVLVMPEYSIIEPDEAIGITKIKWFISDFFSEAMNKYNHTSIAEHIAQMELNDFNELIQSTKKQHGNSGAIIVKELLGVYSEMAKYNIDSMDLHTENLGWSQGGNLVFFDMGTPLNDPDIVQDPIGVHEQQESNKLSNVELKRGSDGHDEYYIQAILEGKVIGQVAFYTVNDSFSYFEEYMGEDRYNKLFPDNQWIDVQFIEVSSRWRKYGLGRKLFSAAVRWAEEFGLPLYGNASPMGVGGPNAQQLFKFYSEFGFTKLVDQGHNVQMYKPKKNNASTNEGDHSGSTTTGRNREDNNDTRPASDGRMSGMSDPPEITEKKWSERWASGVARGPANPLFEPQASPVNEGRKRFKLTESQMQYLWENSKSTVIDVVSNIIKSKDEFYPNRYDLIAAIKNWPEGVDGENFEYYVISTSRIVVGAGGDWQESTYLDIRVRDGELFVHKNHGHTNSFGDFLSKTEVRKKLKLD